jgi:hypothetical protein
MSKARGGVTCVASMPSTLTLLVLFQVGTCLLTSASSLGLYCLYVQVGTYDYAGCMTVLLPLSICAPASFSPAAAYLFLCRLARTTMLAA